MAAHAFTFNHLRADENGLVGVGVHFQRVRCVTGYLVDDLSRFNNAKRAEIEDRVKHTHVGKV